MTLIPTLRRVRPPRRQFPTAAPRVPVPQPRSAEPLAASEPAPTPRLRDWVGVLAMCTGLVMAIMDVQIITSSLTQIQGGLSASADEIAWVQTAYLIADVVMVPLSGMMSRLLSTRVLFVVAALGFTSASALCATATSLGQMILYRAMQGFCGGAITPSVFPVVYTKFRGKQLASVMVLISLILNLSSTLGPTIGGYLTDTLSWHWLFLVNIPPGILVAFAVWAFIDIDEPDLSLLRYFDIVGLVTMALFCFAAVSGWVGPLLTPKIGHRGIAIWGFAIVLVSLLVAAAALYTDHKYILPFAAAGMLWGHYWDASNCMTIPTMVAKPEYRGTASGFAYMFVKLPSFLAIFLFPSLFTAIGQANATLFVAIFPLIGLLAAIFILPEVYGYEHD